MSEVYRVQLTDKAERELAALPKHIQRTIARSIDRIAQEPRRSPSTQLAGHPELRRVHASKDYVIVYSIFDDRLLVLVVRIAHRREVYRRL